ncbi:uncharacterized protein L203_105472 [Cryptococcus depauperatus CBS 7841]|uniref:Uncharacterized protein n=1 Tax=Cryptococcus depauperatus CBS 7841 TaxID=1295531 RepID=A0A1E3ID76_9TREE|nr:hypothetical protein L203_04150 [Cryptococcus depauperatus CBS 7841]
MMISILPLLFLPLLPLTPTVLAQNDKIDCPDTDLATYLISLIDVLFANGLTTSEEYIVHLSQTDEGYQLLENLYMSQKTWTFLAPTDEAWQKANIWPPFGGVTDQWGAELLALHALQGEWSSAVLPSSGVGIASTFLQMKDEMNATSSNSQAYQAVVMDPGHDGSVIVDGWWGNGTSWSGFMDTSSSQALKNVKILPIDTVLSFPPNLAEALTTSGLSNISSALDVVGKKDELQQLTDDGFTIFAPIDAVWSDEIKGIMTDDDQAQVMVANHYTTAYTLYSPGWRSDSFDFQVTSGQTLKIKVGNDGSSSVTLGNVTAKIIKSDITLANGVMHVIDAVLVGDISYNSTGKTSHRGTATNTNSGSKSKTTDGSLKLPGQVSNNQSGSDRATNQHPSAATEKFFVGTQLLLCLATASALILF